MNRLAYLPTPDSEPVSLADRRKQQVVLLRRAAPQLDWVMLSLLTAMDAERLRALFLYWFPTQLSIKELPGQRHQSCYLCNTKLLPFSADVVCGDCFEQVYTVVSQRCVVHDNLRIAQQVIVTSSESVAIQPREGLPVDPQQASLHLKNLLEQPVDPPVISTGLVRDPDEPMRQFGFRHTPTGQTQAP